MTRRAPGKRRQAAARAMIAITMLTGLLRAARSEEGSGSPPDPVAVAIMQTKAEIVRDTEALNRMRSDLAIERRPLAERLEYLRAAVAARRAAAARLRRLRETGQKDLAALTAETAALEDQARFLMAVFSEYARAMETRVQAAEGVLLADKLRLLDDALTADAAAGGHGAGIDALLALAEGWNRQRLGGHAFEGQALCPAGIEHTGVFAVFGPLAYFAADDGALAGAVFTRFGHVLPVLGDLGSKRQAAAITRVLAGEQDLLPVDVTAGDAIKLDRARVSLFEHARRGGLVMLPLLGVGLLAIVLTAWKALALSRLQVSDGRVVKIMIERLRCGDVAGAGQVARNMRKPLAALAGTVIRHREAPRDRLEENLHETISATMPRMERHLGTLAVLGGVAPLLGLLGTVTGMIHTFQLVTIFGSGDARLLSGGISEALTTTATGLLIAIPVLLAHAFLLRKTRGLVAALEQTAVSMVNDLTPCQSAESQPSGGEACDVRIPNP